MSSINLKVMTLELLVAAPNLLNALPDELRHHSQFAISLFKKHLKQTYSKKLLILYYCFNIVNTVSI